MSQIIDNPWFTGVRNPMWGNAEHTVITCEVNFIHVGFEEWTLFGATATDYMPYTAVIFERCIAGEFGPIAEYVDPMAGVEDMPVHFDSQTWRELQALDSNPLPKVII